MQPLVRGSYDHQSEGRMTISRNVRPSVGRSCDHEGRNGNGRIAVVRPWDEGRTTVIRPFQFQPSESQFLPAKKCQASKPKVKPKFAYTKEIMQEVVDAVLEGMTCFEAARTHTVPRSTLQNKVKGKSPLDSKMGPNSILPEAEETT